MSQVLSDYPPNAGFTNGLFVMTTATDHKNNLNRSALKKNYVRTLRVETIADSAGGTAEVAIVAQPSTGFLNGRFCPDGTPTEDTEDCLGRITVGLTRSKSLTLLVSPLDMMGLIGMAQVIATIACWSLSGSLRSNFHITKLKEAKALVEAPNAFIQATTRIMQDKQNHPVIAQMISPEKHDDPPPSERAASSSGGHSRRGAVTRPPAQQHAHFQ